ncbi:MAG TPA: hypothetical protein VEX62_05795 [Candidatus Limnocylindrales bacterium]|nr:hypothetical protein [Candidatus Limnocylindrales bacterium]
MFQQIRARLGRPTLYVAVGLAVGALLAPAFSGGGAQAVTTYTRSASCHGLGFSPAGSHTAYFQQGGARILENGHSDFMFCAIGLPHKAAVTRFQVTGYDASTMGSITNCGLVRNSLTLAGTETFQSLAGVNPTTLAGTPGRFASATTTINASYKSIDNAAYAYFVQCQVIAPNVGADSAANIRLYGATVTYRITAANG